MESKLDTPEHAAYRAEILAYGTDAQEEAKAYLAEHDELQDKLDELRDENEWLRDDIKELEKEVRELEDKNGLLEARLDELAS